MTITSLLYLILSILGLSFLIFIHELGHYYMARRSGMRVETFSIGFGKPIYCWKRGDTNWQIGWFLFGGYVKIAGMDSEENKDPYEIKEGFFGKKPFERIKVAAMGPIVNIIFGFLIFAILWSLSGREKNFSEFTHKIGWIDPKSELYAQGVRPGDEIQEYNHLPYQGAKDHVTAAMTSPGYVYISGNHINPITKEKTPFNYSVKTYPHPTALDPDILTTGILQPASYLVYPKSINNIENSLPEGSPMVGSGIEGGDRIIWIDGITLYSSNELSHILNSAKAYITLQRGQDIITRRVPRIHIGDLRIDNETKEELIDWQFEAGLKSVRFAQLFTIPYELTHEGIVEGTLKLIDSEKEEEVFPRHLFSQLDAPLKEGDKILAIDGRPVKHTFEILFNLQEHFSNIIVQRGGIPHFSPIWKQADSLFDSQYHWEDLHKLSSQIGLTPPPQIAGNLVLLKSVLPKARKDFALSAESKAKLQDEIEQQLLVIEKIDDKEKKALALRLFKENENQLFLGLPSIQDERVQYNPTPFALFGQVFEEIFHTLEALITGALSPKWMSGPVGIVQVVHDRSMISLKEALYWLGAISLNLGFLNLLPLPVLDGGTICFSLYEWITGKRVKPKTLERLIIPFAVLLITFFIFLTYHDISRILIGK